LALHGRLQNGVLGCKRRVFDPHVGLQLHHLRFGLLQLQPHHPRLLHPLNGCRLRFNVRSRQQRRKAAFINPATPRRVLLRMLDSIKVIPSGQPDKFRLVFSAPGGSAIFDLNASSVRNPFTMGALRAFRCPAAL
jgi:hypothetical protein